MNIQPYARRGEKNEQKKEQLQKKLVHSQNSKPIQPAAHPHLKKKEPPDTRPPLQPTLSLSSPSPDFPSTDQRAAAPPLFKKNIFFTQVSHQRAPPFLHLSHLPHRHQTTAPTIPSPRFQPFPFGFIFPSRQPKLSFPLSPKTNPKPAISSFWSHSRPSTQTLSLSHQLSRLFHHLSQQTQLLPSSPSSSLSWPTTALEPFLPLHPK